MQTACIARTPLRCEDSRVKYVRAQPCVDEIGSLSHTAASEAPPTKVELAAVPLCRAAEA